MRGQVPPRPTGVLLGLTTTLNPFSFYPSFGELWPLPLEEKLRRLRDPAMRSQLLSEQPTVTDGLVGEITTSFDKMFRLGDPAEYEPPPEASIAGQARSAGCRPEEIAYEMLLTDEGTAVIYHPLFNYLPGDLSYVQEMMEHPYTVMGLSDGGAHCGIISDASFPTTLIQHWGRDRTRGPKMALETLIAKQTRETAELVGLYDRGIIAPGYKADLNLIDFEALTIHAPKVVNDLPAGGRRLVQHATGYVASLVAGVVAFREGEPTGALNGRVLRGGQPSPSPSSEHV